MANGPVYTRTVDGLQVQTRTDENGERYVCVGEAGRDPVEIPARDVADLLSAVRHAAHLVMLQVTQI